MYVHLGENTVINGDDIIGIFDLDNTTVMKSTREYLKNASKNKKVINVSYELPKSFTITAKDDYNVYISLLNVQTIARRIRNFKNKEIL